MKKMKKILLSVLLVCLFAALTGCSNSLVDQAKTEKTGVITASVNLTTGFSTIASADSFSDLQPGDFKFTLRDSNGVQYGDSKTISIDDTTSSPEVVFNSIEPGDYTVNVIATDSEGYTVFEGSENTVVMSESTTAVTVDMTLAEGDLTVNVTLPADKAYKSGTVCLSNDFNDLSNTVDKVLTEKSAATETTPAVWTTTFNNIKSGQWPITISLVADDDTTTSEKGQVSVLPSRDMVADIVMDADGSIDINLNWDFPPAAPLTLLPSYDSSTGTVTLSWDSYGTDIEGFMVYRSMDVNGRKELLTESLITDNTYIDSSTLHESTQYVYWVQAYNSNGLASDYSQPCFITIGQGVSFTDPYLEMAIRDQIGVHNRELTHEDLYSISNLHLDEYDDGDITSLDGIDKLINLERLELFHFKNINSFGHLENLTRLRDLEIYECGLTDITFLAKITNLKYLWIEGNNISDFSPLANLTNLSSLGIGGNNITSENIAGLFTILESITELNYLSLRESNLGDTDLSNFLSLSSLGHINLDRNNITDFSTLSTLPNLRALDLTGNDIDNISYLSNFTDLTRIEIGDNPITDYSPIGNLTNLQTLGLRNAVIKDYSALNLGNMTDLTHLHLYDSNFSDSDLTYISNMTQLDHLGLDNTNISDLSIMESLTNLRHLELNRCNISDVTQLNNLLNLGRLDRLEIGGNPLNYNSQEYSDIKNQLENNGVYILY